MANDFYKEGWKTFLKCKQCNVFKELNNCNWYKHKQWFLWVSWRCKECILAWRKTEHELEMARKRDYNRYHNNIERRKYQQEKSSLKRKEKWYWHIHTKTERTISKLGIRPSVCQFCWRSDRILAHHPNYNERYNIVFCCQRCHNKIHKGNINIEWKNIYLIPF